MKPFDPQPIGLFEINLETGEQYWSLDLRRIVGLPETGPIDFETLLRRVHPGDRAAFVAFALEIFRDHCAPHHSFEHRLLDPDGSIRRIHLETGAAFYRDDRTSVIRIIGLVVEIAVSDIIAPPPENFRALSNHGTMAMSLAPH
jgi:PAS domain-containing protein